MTSMLDALKLLQRRGVPLTSAESRVEVDDQVARQGVQPEEIYVSPAALEDPPEVEASPPAEELIDLTDSLDTELGQLATDSIETGTTAESILDDGSDGEIEEDAGWQGEGLGREDREDLDQTHHLESVDGWELDETDEILDETDEIDALDDVEATLPIRTPPSRLFDDSVMEEIRTATRVAAESANRDSPSPADSDKADDSAETPSVESGNQTLVLDKVTQQQIAAAIAQKSGKQEDAEEANLLPAVESSKQEEPEEDAHVAEIGELDPPTPLLTLSDEEFEPVADELDIEQALRQAVGDELIASPAPESQGSQEFAGDHDLVGQRVEAEANAPGELFFQEEIHDETAWEMESGDEAPVDVLDRVDESLHQIEQVNEQNGEAAGNVAFPPERELVADFPEYPPSPHAVQALREEAEEPQQAETHEELGTHQEAGTHQELGIVPADAFMEVDDHEDAFVDQLAHEVEPASAEATTGEHDGDYEDEDAGAQDDEYAGEYDGEHDGEVVEDRFDFSPLPDHDEAERLADELVDDAVEKVAEKSWEALAAIEPPDNSELRGEVADLKDQIGRLESLIVQLLERPAVEPSPEEMASDALVTGTDADPQTTELEPHDPPRAAANEQAASEAANGDTFLPPGTTSESANFAEPVPVAESFPVAEPVELAAPVEFAGASEPPETMTSAEDVEASAATVSQDERRSVEEDVESASTSEPEPAAEFSDGCASEVAAAGNEADAADDRVEVAQSLVGGDAEVDDHEHLAHEEGPEPPDVVSESADELTIMDDTDLGDGPPWTGKASTAFFTPPNFDADAAEATVPEPVETPSLKVVDPAKPAEFASHFLGSEASVPAKAPAAPQFVDHLATIEPDGTIRRASAAAGDHDHDPASVEVESLLAETPSPDPEATRDRILSVLGAEERESNLAQGQRRDETGAKADDSASADVLTPPSETPDIEPVMPEATGYELVLRSNLDNAELADQYRALWSACLEADSGKQHLALTTFGCHDEPHVAEVVAQLATMLARRRSQKILLVDGNVISQTLSKAFHATDRPGLAEIGGMSREWQDCVVPTASPNLALIPCGLDIAQDFDEETIASCVEEWSLDYDFVLIDGGFVGSPLMKPLVEFSNRAMILVRLGKTQRNEATAALGAIKEMALKTHGCIVTNCDDFSSK